MADSTGVRGTLIKFRNLQIRGTGRLDSFIGYQFLEMRNLHKGQMNKLLKIFSVALLFCLPVFGQVPTFTPYENHGLYSINLQNLNVVVNVPIRHKAGALPLSADYQRTVNTVVYDGVRYTIGTMAEDLIPNTDIQINGVLAGARSSVGFSSKTAATCPADGSSTSKYSGWFYKSPDGTSHSLPGGDLIDLKSDGVTSCLSSHITDVVTDGTGFTIAVTTTGVTVYNASGTSALFSLKTAIPLVFNHPTVIKDSNNNTITAATDFSTITDSLNLPALTTSTSVPQTFTWPDASPTGTQQTVLNTTTYEHKTAFNCPSKVDLGVTTKQFITDFSFPDGTDLGVSYEQTPSGTSSQVTGRLGSLTLPTGGIVSFGYTGGNHGLDCTFLVPPTMTRTTPEGVWTYVWATTTNTSGAINGNSTTVTDPAGNVTVYTFTGMSSAGPSLFFKQVLTHVVVKQGPSWIQRTTDICYNGQTLANCMSDQVAGPIVETTTYTTIPLMTPGSPSKVDTTFDTYGNVLTYAAYDFGASTPTTTTTFQYGTFSSGSCTPIGNFINNRICNKWTTDGTTTQTNETMTYDTKGNRLTDSVWTGASTNKWLTTTNTYNSNGALATSTGFSGVLTSATYGQCNSVFPTQVTVGGLTTNSTWNCNGGVLVTTTDPNGKSTTLGYTNSSGAADPFWRKSFVTDNLGNTTYQSYGNTSESIFSFGSSVDDTLATVNSVGKPIRSQHRQGPSSSAYDTVSSSYGISGNYFTESSTVPCTKSLGDDCTVGITTTTRDTLGRVYTITNGASTPGVITKSYIKNDVYSTLSPAPTGENVKSTQKEYDGLGRLTSTCSILSAGGTSCGQSNPALGTQQTTYTYTTFSGGSQVDIARGTQVRTSKFDGLGRMTYKSDPEKSAAFNYYYDVQAACGGSSDGHLTRIVDASGNSTCYFYDATTGRLKSVSANGASCRHFYYDNSGGFTGTRPTGVVISNGYGRLVSAATSDCAGNLVTDEWFSYNASGKLTHMWEKTPHSGGYYHTVATYYGNGNINTLAGIPGFTTETYGIDGEGRLNSAYESTTAVVSDVDYNATGNPLTIDIGVLGGDSDNYGYDPSTGRISNWTFTVGTIPVSQIGNLTWNANGTLKYLIITDGFNAGGAQTCNSGYDDIARLTSFDCGSGGWGQTFSFGQHNNLTKAVISGRTGITFNPGYDINTNHYTLSGTSYDNNGNLLNDTFHTYTWNGFNQLKTIDGASCGTTGTCLTYDALGRMVEKSVNSTYTEVLYSPLGKTATMSGQTTTSAYIPMPGGATLYKTNDSTRHFWHKDWLGSARLSSTVNNHTIVFDRAFAPYGEMYQNFGVTNELSFTGDTQDTVAGTFDTPSRELNPNQGRWVSPDPSGSGWNQYAYVTDPNSSIDPSGFFSSPVPNGWFGAPSGDCEIWCDGGDNGGDGFSADPDGPGDQSAFGQEHPCCDTWGNWSGNSGTGLLGSIQNEWLSFTGWMEDKGLRCVDVNCGNPMSPQSEDILYHLMPLMGGVGGIGGYEPTVLPTKAGSISEAQEILSSGIISRSTPQGAELREFTRSWVALRQGADGSPLEYSTWSRFGDPVDTITGSPLDGGFMNGNEGSHGDVNPAVLESGFRPNGDPLPPSANSSGSKFIEYIFKVLEENF